MLAVLNPLSATDQIFGKKKMSKPTKSTNNQTPSEELTTFQKKLKGILEIVCFPRDPNIWTKTG